MQSDGQVKDGGGSPGLSEKMAGVLCWVGNRVIGAVCREREETE